MLNIKRLLEYSSSTQSLPEDAFIDLLQWVDNLNLEQLKNEYLVFSKSFSQLIKNNEPSTKIHVGYNANIYKSTEIIKVVDRS